ncbi:MAG: HTH domain-containing protein [Acidimicrobiia bacterium]|nr:HTH domain-containing protein [Acidimicrobiia bacterium]
MPLLDSVAHILKETGPLHYRDITNELLNRGLWSTKGKTPEATVNARIATDIKNKGVTSQFTRVTPGVFHLTQYVTAGSESPDNVGTPGGNTTMSFTDSAEYILDIFADRKPMHYREITDRALSEGILVTKGATPEATMYAQILTEIKRRTQRSDDPRFVKHGKGMVGLWKWTPKGVARTVAEHNKVVRRQLRTELLNLSPKGFEELIGLLLAEMGFDSVEVTPLSNDGGIDVRGNLIIDGVLPIRMAVQAKRWKANVQAPAVQQLRGSLGAEEHGMLITASGFSKGATTEAERPGATHIAIVTGDELVDLLVRYEIGVARTEHTVAEVVDGGLVSLVEGEEYHTGS